MRVGQEERAQPFPYYRGQTLGVHPLYGAGDGGQVLPSWSGPGVSCAEERTVGFLTSSEGHWFYFLFICLFTIKFYFYLNLFF